MKLKKHIRYSEAFKQQVVEQIEAGKFRNMAAVNQAYGVRGTSTVIRWIKQYGSDKSLPQQIKIMSLNEIDEAHELKKRAREHWSISMTEVNHCAENSNAVRVNGILKMSIIST